MSLVLGFAAAAAAHDQDDPLGALQADEFAATVASASAHVPRSDERCTNGYAGEFPCDGIDLLSFVPLDQLGATFVNDIWGWSDAVTRHEYALVGAAEGTVFVDVTTPHRPVVLGILPTHSTDGGEFWRDIKVYADHAFVVSEYEDHGMQVFDLTELRGLGPADGYQVFAETAHYGGIGHSHNVAINEATAYAYIVGSDDCAGGLHMVDISNPGGPAFAGCFVDDGYTHDTQCVTYHGPDLDYYGNELCFSSNANFDDTPFLNTLSIVDVTDKSNPIGIANVEYADDGYSHQGWLTEDHAQFLHGDELDELFFANPTRTRIWDVTDLDNPSVIGVFDNTTAAIDHNIYIEGNTAFASNYTSGLRLYDTSQVAAGVLTEVGYFDVYPENDNASFEGGTWSNYPFFTKADLVAVTGMDRGLFLLAAR